MNTLENIYKTLESDEFAIRAGVASGFETLEQCFKAESAIQELLSVSNSPDIAAIASRLTTLCRRDIDERYSNPWDFAIAAYLWVLDQLDRVQAIEISDEVSRVPNLWWGEYLSNKLLRLEKKGSGSEQLENGTPFGEIFNMRQEVINLEGEGTGTSRLLQRKSIRDCFAGMSQGESFSLPLKTISEGPRNIDNSMFNVGDYSNAGWHNVDMVNESEAADSAHPEHVTNTLGRSGHHWPEQTTEEVSTFQPGEVDYLLAA